MEPTGLNVTRRSIAICKAFWKIFLAVVLPIILILVMYILKGQEGKVAYVALLMAIFWMLELIPLSATALIPVVFFPLFSIADTDRVTRLYMKDTIMLLISCRILSTCVEDCNLHKRIALKMLFSLGTTFHRLLLSTMITSMFLSMWISNVATTTMMVPIIDTITTHLEESYRKDKSGKKEKPLITSEVAGKSTGQGSDMVKIPLLLSVAYSTSLGGTGSLIGTETNLVFKGMMEIAYPKSNEITFTTWMIYNIPCMVICVLVAWSYISFDVIDYKPESADDNKTIRKSIETQYNELGRISFHEVVVLVLYTILIIIWISRNPNFIPGWVSLFDSEINIHDATAATATVLLLFIIPSRPREPGQSSHILDWKIGQEKLSWESSFLVGGGYAILYGAKKSGLGQIVGEMLTILEFMSTDLLIIILCTITATFTQVFSSIATANILLPIVSELAEALKLNPLRMMLPVTLCCSYAFVLPSSTPQNTIVCRAGSMNIGHTFLPGLIMTITCCLLQFGMLVLLGRAMFSLKSYPVWVNVSNMTLVY